MKTRIGGGEDVEDIYWCLRAGFVSPLHENSRRAETSNEQLGGRRSAGGCGIVAPAPRGSRPGARAAKAKLRLERSEKDAPSEASEEQADLRRTPDTASAAGMCWGLGGSWEAMVLGAGPNRTPPLVLAGTQARFARWHGPRSAGSQGCPGQPGFAKVSRSVAAVCMPDPAPCRRDARGGGGMTGKRRLPSQTSLPARSSVPAESWGTPARCPQPPAKTPSCSETRVTATCPIPIKDRESCSPATSLAKTSHRS